MTFWRAVTWVLENCEGPSWPSNVTDMLRQVDASVGVRRRKREGRVVVRDMDGYIFVALLWWSLRVFRRDCSRCIERSVWDILKEEKIDQSFISSCKGEGEGEGEIRFYRRWEVPELWCFVSRATHPASYEFWYSCCTYKTGRRPESFKKILWLSSQQQRITPFWMDQYEVTPCHEI